jgi:hypothetical protein
MYRGYDADLMGLYQTVGPRVFGSLARESMRLLVRPGYIPQTDPPAAVQRYSGEKTSMSVELNILKEEDEDLRELLSHVQERKLGQFIKMSLRFYAGRFTCLSSMLDLELEEKKVYCAGGESFLFLGTPQGMDRSISAGDRKNTGKKQKKNTAQAQAQPQMQMPPQMQGYPPYYMPYPYMPYMYGMPQGNVQGREMPAYPYPAPYPYQPQAPAGSADETKKGRKPKAQVQPEPVETGTEQAPAGTGQAQKPVLPDVTVQKTPEFGKNGVEQLAPDNTGIEISIAEPAGADDDEDELLALLEGMM